jgi:hypothetical protein
MAVQKNFTIRNGIEVNNNLLVADSVLNRVGVGSTTPKYTFEVIGGIGATHINILGISTALTEFNVGTGGTVITSLNTGLTGFGTHSPAYIVDIRSPVSTGQTALYVQGDLRTTGNLSANEFYAINTNLIGIATIQNLLVSGVSTVGFITASNLRVSGVSTVGFITASNLYVSGVGTFLSSGLKIRNPANTFEYGITAAAITANRTLTLPLITGTDTLATLGLSQTFSAAQTFSSTLTASGTITLSGSATGTHVFGSSQTSGTITLGGASGTGAITVGLATTSQTLNLATGVSGVGTTKTINFGTAGATGSFTQINIGSTAGVGTVLVNTGTRLGIGSAIPRAALDVVGDGRVSGVVTATTFIGALTGTATTATAAGYASTSGISTVAQGLTGTPNINVGIVTATSYNGSGTNLTGIVTSIVAGTNISISGSTGEVTISASGVGGGGTSSQWVTTAVGIHTISNVGIGTTNPTSKLTVQGDALVVGIVTSNGYNATTGNDYEINNISVLTSTTLGSGVVNSSLTSVGTLTRLAVTGISTLGVTTTTNLTTQNINNSGITTTNSLNIGATQVISSARQLQNIASLDATTTATIESAIANAPNTFTNLQITGISTFTNGPVLVGTATSTGTASQTLQVTGGAYVSGNVGIGTTISLSPLQVERFGTKTGFGTFSASSGIATDIDTFTISSTNFITAEYTVHIGYGTYIQAQKVLIMQNGTTAYSQEYGIMYDPSLIVSIGATISGGVCKLQVTPETGISGLTTYRFVRGALL